MRWANLDVSKSAGSRSMVFMQAIHNSKHREAATMRRHVPIRAPRQPYNWQDQVTFVENHQNATAYIALAGNDSYSRQMSLATSGVIVRVVLISQGKEGDLVSRRCQVNPSYTDKARRKINLPS